VKPPEVAAVEAAVVVAVVAAEIKTTRITIKNVQFKLDVFYFGAYPGCPRPVLAKPNKNKQLINSSIMAGHREACCYKKKLKMEI
jgi:hypothetical protein